MDLNNLSFGQKVDVESGLIMLWLTHGALDEIKSMDLSDKIVWMWGGGLGDAWLAKRCKYLFVVERNQEWIFKSYEICKQNGITNIEYLYRPCNDSDGQAEYYCEISSPLIIDVIINDDAYRTECCQASVNYFKRRNKEGILICDNWVQSFVWISPKAEEIMQPFEAHIHEQEDHLDNDGVNKWKTAIHFIK